MKKTFRSEADVKTAVKQLLAKYEDVWYFMPSMNGYGRAGIPDFICKIDTWFLAIETKFGRNTPSPAQKIELRRIYESHGVALIINEETLGTLDEVLDYMTLGLYMNAYSLSKATLNAYGIEV